MRKLYSVVFIVILSLTYYIGYTHGINSSALEYEKLSNTKDEIIRDKDKQIERALLAVKRTAAEKINHVEKHFIPVDREVIRYVSKKDTSICNTDFTKWMQLHNKAANGIQENSSGGIINDTSSKPTRENQ